MKNRLIYCPIMLLGILAIGCEKKFAKLEVINGESFDFGQVLIGDTVNHKFLIKNIGNSDLEIAKIQSNCSCTVSNTQTEIVKPNSSSNIKIQFIGKVEDIGINDKQIAIRSNSSPKITILHLKGNVISK